MPIDHLGDAILIVDDEEANVRLLSHVLRRAGYVASTSTLKSAEVSALHREHHYALIVLDLQMPVMTGYEVMAELMKLPEADRPSILVMSADPTQSTPSTEAGATDFLGKPYSLTDVVVRIQAILSARTSPPGGAETDAILPVLEKRTVTDPPAGDDPVTARSAFLLGTAVRHSG